MSENPVVLEKKNVNVFNSDVAENKGYRYTNNAPFSSVVANLRQTQETLKLIDSDAKTLVDIGCGDGTYTEEIAKARPDLKIAGFDPAAVAVQLAKEKNPAREVSRRGGAGCRHKKNRPSLKVGWQYVVVW
ncbi:MAG: methyltransferase domain-containing protein [Chitinophagaceae bacterium]|nr:methyltransferase domain-containing protein [Chitinophagaceae bacterium]